MNDEKVPAPLDDGGLDAAWREAVALLPQDWAIYLRPTIIGTGVYTAEARWRGIWLMANGPLPSVQAEADTPAAALRALAETLRNRG